VFILGAHDARVLAGIVLALAAALSFAAAGALQHRTTSKVARSANAGGLMPVLGLLPRLFASRVWWFGFGFNVLGFGLHSAALHLGSISVVQALLCVQLMFALPFARTAPLARDWFGTIAICLGISTLVAARGPVPQTMERAHLAPFVVLAGLCGVLLLVVTAKAFYRTALIGTAAGIGFSVTAVLIVLVAGQMVHNGWSAVFTSWQIYGLASSGLIAAVLVQDAFAAGSFPAALTAMTIADPLASWLWGAILFDAVPPTAPLALASLILAAALVGVGVSALANSPTLNVRLTLSQGGS
jgi:hypothetical protein